MNSVQCGGQRVVEWLRVSLCVCVRHCLDGKSMAGVSKLQLTKEENYAESVLKKESAAVACVHVCVAAAGHTHPMACLFFKHPSIHINHSLKFFIAWKDLQQNSHRDFLTLVLGRGLESLIHVLHQMFGSGHQLLSEVGSP